MPGCSLLYFGLIAQAVSSPSWTEFTCPIGIYWRTFSLLFSKWTFACGLSFWSCVSRSGLKYAVTMGISKWFMLSLGILWVTPQSAWIRLLILALVGFAPCKEKEFSREAGMLQEEEREGRPEPEMKTDRVRNPWASLGGSRWNGWKFANVPLGLVRSPISNLWQWIYFCSSICQQILASILLCSFFRFSSNSSFCKPCST